MGDKREQIAEEETFAVAWVLRATALVLCATGAGPFLDSIRASSSIVGHGLRPPTIDGITALSFLLCGLSLLFQTVQIISSRPIRSIGVSFLIGVSAMALINVLQHIPGLEYHLTRLSSVLPAFIQTSVGGASGLNTAICHLLAVACIGLVARTRNTGKNTGTLAWLGALLTSGAVVTLVAHFDARTVSYHWLALTRMPISVAVLFVIQGVVYVWVASTRGKFRWALGRTLTFEFISGLAVLMTIALLVRWSAVRFGQANARLRKAAELLENTWTIRNAIDGLDMAFRDSENSEQHQGPHVLAPTPERQIQRLEALLAEFSRTLAKQPTQQKRYLELEAATREWIDQEKITRAPFKTHDKIARQTDGTESSAQNNRKKVYRLLSEMFADERVAARLSDKLLDKELERTFGLLPLGMILGTLVLGYGLVRLSLEMDGREQLAKALALQDERQRFSIEAAGIGDWELDPISQQISRSLRYDQIFGFSEKNPDWTYETLLSHVYLEDRDGLNAEYQNSIQTGSDLSRECQIVHPDGSVKWIWLRGRCFKDKTGRVESIKGVISDITETRNAAEKIRTLNTSLEQRVKDRTEKLEIAIQELDAFTYSISHDLRAPLRAIDGFSKMLTEDHSAQLPEEAKRKLFVISSEAQRMSRLIDDLLAFSRLGRAQVHPEAINMQRMAQDTFSELQQLSGGTRQIEFKIHPLPPANGTAPMIRQVWTNLISNALKFTRGSPKPAIEIGAKTTPEEGTIYYIKDNGVGFDMRHADKLFGVFQRLHSDKEFEGTGAGLALVQRIIQRHGGRIWADAQPHKGATFFFTIPSEAA